MKNIQKDYQDLLYTLFENIDGNTIIECWQSKYLEKADIKIRINKKIKGISIKSGYSCSMHQESIQSFYNFLIKIGISDEIINALNDFMIGYVNGKRVSSSIYISNNKNKIEKINNELNQYYVKVNLIIRFLFQGTEFQKYDCDAIIYGTPEKFLWASKDEILKYLENYKIIKRNQINVSALNIKSYDRNLRNDPNRIKSQEEIQIKWYTITQDLLTINKMRKIKLIEK